MFETLVTGILTNALGHVIDPKCFSSDKINVAVWSGYVVLRELEVKPEIFADQPTFNLVRGVCGSIELKIPWNRLNSDSVVVTVDDVYLLVRTEEDIETVMMNMDEFTIKKKLLEELYQQAKSSEQNDTVDANTESGFAARLINKIIDNLELHVRRIHIRVEDHTTGDHPFALGLTIESVHVQSTNSNWQPSYVDTSKTAEPRIYKIIELNHLSVYLNPDCEVLRDRSLNCATCSLEEFSNAFNRSIPKRFDDRQPRYQHYQLYPSHQQHHFLLKPIDASARLIVNRDPLEMSSPSVEIDVNIPEVAFRLEESQYCDLLYLLSLMQIPEHYAKFIHYRKFRPSKSVLESAPGEWWKYAVNAVIEDVRRKKQRWSWPYMKQRRDDRKKYIVLWEEKCRHVMESQPTNYLLSDSEQEDDAGLINGNNSGSTDDFSGDDDMASNASSVSEASRSSHGGGHMMKIDAALLAIERQRTVEDILFFRYLADLNVKKSLYQKSPSQPSRPIPSSVTFSDTESVDTDATESSLPTEMRYRSWGAWMFGWTSKLARPSGGGGDIPCQVLPEVELRELFKILEYEPGKRSKNKHQHARTRQPDVQQDGIDDSNIDVEFTVVFRVTVTLQKGSITLSSDPETNRKLHRDDPAYSKKYTPTDFLLGTFSHLQLAAETRTDAMKIDVSLQSIEAYDESAESSAFSRLLSRKQVIRNGGTGGDVDDTKLSGVVFLLSYETNPVNSSADASLFVHLEPLEIVFSPTAMCWGRLASFTNTPKVLGLWAELEVASFNDIVNLKARTEAKLNYAMANRIALFVDLRVQAPVIIIPESDTDFNCARLAVDLGHINFRTDRLSKLDDGILNAATGGSGSMESGPSSLVLLNPSSSPNLTASTSFVKQLYDEAEKGEGAVRWKEEFYDKFSLSITDVHVLLVPYGKKPMVPHTHHHGTHHPSVSLPPYLRGSNDDEQDYELIERFNINVTVRTSVLPLDATLTRFYIHADLPGLTFNMSIEKYFQLAALVARFNVSHEEASQDGSGNSFSPSTELFRGEDSSVLNEDERILSHKRSFLSTSALNKLILEDHETTVSSALETANIHSDDSDSGSSVDSDDTWFSIASGTLDLSTLPMEQSKEPSGVDFGLAEASHSLQMGTNSDGSARARSSFMSRKRPRIFPAHQSTEFLDRRLFVCTFTFPLISVQLKKPHSLAVPASSASYRFDASDFDEDVSDNGTILLRLQGFRLRLAKKTLSTQVNLSFRSVEVEDYLNTSGRSTEYLIFSSPSIEAPYAMRAPMRRGPKYPNSTATRRRSSRQRERVISFQRSQGSDPRPGQSAMMPASDNLLELVYSSVCDQASGAEVLRDLDAHFGSIHLNFDQAYVCSLVELIDETLSTLPLVSAPTTDYQSRDESQSQTVEPPLLELDSSVAQEYTLPMSLTDSVLADLELARKHILEQRAVAFDTETHPSTMRAQPIQLKVRAYVHSISVCFYDRGDPMASVAVLRSQLQLSTSNGDHLSVQGTVGDVKMFDLCTARNQYHEQGLSELVSRGLLRDKVDYIDIFGLDTSSSDGLSTVTHNILSINCIIAKNSEALGISGVVNGDPSIHQAIRSKLSISIQPVRLLMQPEFIEVMTTYVLDGQLRLHFQLKNVPEETNQNANGLFRERSQSFALDKSLQQTVMSPPFDSKYFSPRGELSTPFFDAIDASDKRKDFRDKENLSIIDGRGKKKQEKSVKITESVERVQETNFLDGFDIDIKVFHPCIVFPSTPPDAAAGSFQARGGIVIDFGIIYAVLKNTDNSNGEQKWVGRQVECDIKDLEVYSLNDRFMSLLEKSGISLRCVVPRVSTQIERSDDRETGNSVMVKATELPRVSAKITVHPLRLNVGEANVCLALDVFYGTIFPISETIKFATLQNEVDEDETYNAAESERDAGANDDAAPQITTQNRLQFVTAIDVSFVLEELKLVFVSGSEGPHHFEGWLKNILDINDDGHYRDNASSAQSSSPRRQRYHMQDAWDRRNSVSNDPCCIIGTITVTDLRSKLVIDSFGMKSTSTSIPFQCDFSLKEVIILDHITDQEECLTHVFGPVRDTQGYSKNEHSAEESNSRRSLAPCQIVGHLCSKRGMNDNVTFHSLDVNVSSFRFILLPRSVLRLEHFATDVALAAIKKLQQLKQYRESERLKKQSLIGTTGYLGPQNEDGVHGDRSEPKLGLPGLMSMRKNSFSDILAEESSSARPGIMSPLSSAIKVPVLMEKKIPDRVPNTGDDDNSQAHKGTTADIKKVSTQSQWVVNMELSTMQLWVVSTDRRSDLTGIMLSSQMRTRFGNVPIDADSSLSADKVLSTAFVKLSMIELSIISSPDGQTESESVRMKGAHTPWTLVEQFDIAIRYNTFIAIRANKADITSTDGQVDQFPATVDVSHQLGHEDSSKLTLFQQQIPSDWQEWVVQNHSISVENIVSRISFRELPILLKIYSSVTNMLIAEQKIRLGFSARLKSISDDGGWSDDTGGELSRYHADLEDGNIVSADESYQVTVPHVVTLARCQFNGLEFRLINNIVDQESPVVGLSTQTIELALRSESNTSMEITCSTSLEAWYHNLRLVTTEPLIEPWAVEVTLSRKKSDEAQVALSETEAQLEVLPWMLTISSNQYLQFNVTDAFVANMTAANRAWQWIVNEGGNPREMTEYSTYWIRNNTGLTLHYWGDSCRARLLAPGAEEPLEFNKQTGKTSHDTKATSTNINAYDRQLFIALEEDEAIGDLINGNRRWQTESPIPVDQSESRMYALVDSDADAISTKMRKCECVIDVIVERGCKVFVVRSTLLLENKTGSDLEVEFIPPHRRNGSPAFRSGNNRGHTIPSWKAVVKASSIIPLPVHYASAGEGYIMTRPPEIKSVDSGSNLMPKAYAKERVHVPLFDRVTLNQSAKVARIDTDDSNVAQCMIKFHRLYSDRPVRPFVLSACLSSSYEALYHRTLSFHPPMIIHNLTAVPVEYCLSTPSDWVPATEVGNTTSSSVNMGWENSQQRLRERGSINVADSLIWHLSDQETPLELTIRVQGFEWSEPIYLNENVEELVRIKIKDLVSDAFLYITAENRMSAGHCREVFLYVPYWIVNLTGLKLEYEFDEEKTGREHHTLFLAGQKRVDREELLLKESQDSFDTKRGRNPHLIRPWRSGKLSLQETNQARRLSDTLGGEGEQMGYAEVTEPNRRHAFLLPSVPPINGLLDLLPKSIDDSKALGQLEVLQACHSDIRSEKGCVRLRVIDETHVAGIDSVKDASHRKWSDAFGLDQTGTSGEIEAEDYGTDRKYSIGYSIRAAIGRYSRTKVIMLTPRFMLLNTLDCAVDICHSTPKTARPNSIEVAGGIAHSQNPAIISSVSPVVRLDANSYTDFHWTLHFAKSRTIRCRLGDYGWSWSGAIPLSESGEYAVRMRHESTRETKLVRVTLKLDSSCICVYFREESTAAPPYRVENYSLETLRIHQRGVRLSEILLPHHSLDYAWDEPTEERMLVVDMLPSAAGDNSRPVRIGMFLLDKIQRYPDALGGNLGIEICTDGPTRVLRFTDTRLRGGDKGAIITSKTITGDLAESDEHNLLRRFVSSPTLHVAIQLQGIGLSVVDGSPKELVYASISGVSLEILMSEENQMGDTAVMSRLERESHARVFACRFQIQDVQVDNQLQLTPYPVLLRFSNPNLRSRNVDGEIINIPVLQLCLVKHDEYAGINFIRHFSARMLPVHIRVDGSLLYQLAPMLINSNTYGSGTSGWEKESSNVKNDRDSLSQLMLHDFNSSLAISVKILESSQEDSATSIGLTSSAPSVRTQNSNTNSSQRPLVVNNLRYLNHGKIVANEDKKLYFEEFHIDPIRATVSFSFGAVARAIVDGHMSGFSRESSATTVGPLRLLLNAIGTSLTKIANAPFHLKALDISHSFVQPDALATRLASHYQSEALRQAYVILGSVDVLGNPMIAWRNLKGGFHDFIYEPAHGIKKSPKEFAFGMGRGTLSLVRASVYTFLDFNTRILTATSMGLSEACLKLDDYTGYPATRNIYQGFAQGISGLVVSPIHAFEMNGVRGVLPGIFAGAFGLVLKPLLGISLATATTTSTLRDAIDPNTKALLVRARPPRYIDTRTKKLKVYSYVESLGEELVSKLRGGRYRGDGYLGHVDLKHKCLLVTKKRILFLDVRAAQKYEVEWELLADEVVLVASNVHADCHTLTIYYLEDKFGSNYGRRRTSETRWYGMAIHKHAVELPENKVLFVRAMLQQQERPLFTRMDANADDPHHQRHHQPQRQRPSLTSAIDIPSFQQQLQQEQTLPSQYPIFHIPTLQPARSFTTLTQQP